MVAISKPLAMNGAPFIGFDTGLVHPPHYITKGGASVTTTATRAYYAPFFVHEPVTFSSIQTTNFGAGDNGDTYRLALYANDGTAGPGTRIQDIGEVTLTGAAARRTITTTINLQSYSGQWVWVMFHANQAADMYDMKSSTTAGEIINGMGTLGTFGDSYASATTIQSAFRYVDTAYGAAASTAVAPTASITIMPIFGFVK